MKIFRPWERRRLNERVLYFRSFFLILAVVQALLHTYNDADRLFQDWPQQASSNGHDLRPQVIATPLAQIQNTVPTLLKGVMLRSIVMGFVGGPFVYGLFMRRAAWSWSLSIAKIIWDIPAAPELSYIPPYHILLIIRTMGWGFFLNLLWDISNAIFSAYMCQEPLKNGKPLTDNNGSLLNGLKAKKEMTKVFAFWELALVQRYPDRRKLVYVDYDRPEGSAWAQIATISLGNLNSMNNRIVLFQNSSLNKPSPLKQSELQTLPRISTPLRKDLIVQKAPPPSNRLETIESSIGDIAKSYGNSPYAQNPLVHLILGYLDFARQKFLNKRQQEVLTPAGIQTLWTDSLMQFIRSPLGLPFRQTFKRRIRAAVLGTPYSDLSIIVDSITALTSLACSSTTEDPYGTVSRDIPALIRTFCSTTTALENLVAQSPPHWTDVNFQESDRKIEEVEVILAALKGGLKKMVRTFGVYAAELRISEAEMRVARRVTGIEEE